MAYQRGFLRFPRMQMAVQVVLAVLLGVYVFFALLGRTEIGSVLWDFAVLDPMRVIYRFELWRLVTYAALHDLSSPFHLLFNGMMFYFLAPELEYRWGDKKLYLFMLLTALSGGIFVCVAWWLGLSQGIVIGFSGVTLGLLVAWGLSFPDRTLHFFGIIPLTGQQLVLATLAMEVLFALSRTGVSTAAHLGGMAMGAILSLGLWRPARLRFLARKYFGNR